MMMNTRKLMMGGMILALGTGLGALYPAMAQDRPIEGKQGLGKLPNVRPASMATPAPAPAPTPTGNATPSPRPGASPSPRPSANPSAGPTLRPTPLPTPSATPSGTPTPYPTPSPSPGATPVQEAVVNWTVADAGDLLAAIIAIGEEGLFPTDYQPDALRAAIRAGAGDALDQQASKSFAWLVEDLRDGRTPMTARVQWFAVDPDQDDNPTTALMQRATTNHDVPGTLAGLAPTYPDYAALKEALAATPKAQTKLRDAIRINMDRWRWLPRDLGPVYLITNVPEFQLRLAVNGRNIRTYRTIVGKPGRTATPQLAEKVEAVVFNPTWTVPQSIVVGEGLGQQLLAKPRAGYKVTRMEDGSLQVVQQPGNTNSLGRMKIDMPNPHAIYLHDTPSKKLFDASVRAFSHGCIRTDRAVELGMTMAILGAGMSQEDAVATFEAGKYKKVPMTRTFPVYLTYFTYGRDINGSLAAFNDLYGRDGPVIDSFHAPRALHTTQRKSNEEVIKLDNPL